MDLKKVHQIEKSSSIFKKVHQKVKKVHWLGTKVNQIWEKDYWNWKIFINFEKTIDLENNNGFKKIKNKHLYIFSEMNDKSLTIAKYYANIQDSTIIFLNALNKEENEDYDYKIALKYNF